MFWRTSGENILYSAWAYRLEILSPPPVIGAERQTVQLSRSRHWWTALAVSLILGVLYMFFASNKPPVPIPWEADPLFWIGWGPLTALGILCYLALANGSEIHIYRYMGLAVAMIVIATATAVTVWSRMDDIVILSALHLPFVAWTGVGVAITLRQSDPAKQSYAFLVKSVETGSGWRHLFRCWRHIFGLSLWHICCTWHRAP